MKNIKLPILNLTSMYIKILKKYVYAEKILKVITTPFIITTALYNSLNITNLVYAGENDNETKTINTIIDGNVYGYPGINAPTENPSQNHTIIITSGGAVTRAYAGYINGINSSLHVSSNTLKVNTSGIISSSGYAGYAYVSSNILSDSISGIVSNNNTILSSPSISNTKCKIYGGYSFSRIENLAPEKIVSNTVLSNSITVDGNTVNGDIYGGESEVHIGTNSSTLPTSAYSIANNNIVSASGLSNAINFYGGKATNHDVTNSADNNLYIFTSATNNTIEINDSKISNAYGGYATANARAQIKNQSQAQINEDVDVTSNSITINNSISSTNSNIYGGYIDATFSSYASSTNSVSALASANIRNLSNTININGGYINSAYGGYTAIGTTTSAYKKGYTSNYGDFYIQTNTVDIKNNASVDIVCGGFISLDIGAYTYSLSDNNTPSMDLSIDASKNGIKIESSTAKNIYGCNAILKYKKALEPSGSLGITISGGINLTSNTIVLNDASVSNETYGVYTSLLLPLQTTLSISNNSTSASNTNISGNVFGIYSPTKVLGQSNINNNTLSIHGGNLYNSNIYDIYTELSSNTANIYSNYTSIVNATTLGSSCTLQGVGVKISSSGSSKIYDNNLLISGGTISSDIYGIDTKILSSSTAEISSNSSIIRDSNISSKVYGVHSIISSNKSSTISENLLSINGGNINSDVYGTCAEISSTGTAIISKNNLVINSGTISGNIYAAYVSGTSNTSASFSSNTVHINGGQNLNLSNASIYGVYTDGKISSSNITRQENLLSTTGSNIEVKSISNFDTYKFDASSLSKNSKILLSSEGVNLSNCKIIVDNITNRTVLISTENTSNTIQYSNNEYTINGKTGSSNEDFGDIIQKTSSAIIGSNINIDSSSKSLAIDSVPKFIAESYTDSGGTTSVLDTKGLVLDSQSQNYPNIYGTFKKDGTPADSGTVTTTALTDLGTAKLKGGYSVGGGDNILSASHNTVDVSLNISNDSEIYGGYVKANESATVSNNKVTVSLEQASSTTIDIYGGYADTDSATSQTAVTNASNNSVEIKNTSATVNIFGGVAASQNSTASGNTVKISSSTISGTICAGSASTASNNTIILDNSVVNGIEGYDALEIKGEATIQSGLNTGASISGDAQSDSNELILGANSTLSGEVQKITAIAFSSGASNTQLVQAGGSIGGENEHVKIVGGTLLQNSENASVSLGEGTQIASATTDGSVLLHGSASIASWTMQKGNATLAGNATLTGSAVHQEGGNLTNSGSVNMAQIDVGGTLENSGNVTVTGKLGNAGTVTNNQGATINGAVDNAGTFTNASGAAVSGTLGNVGTFTNASGATVSGELDNAGTFANDPGATISGTVKNSGTLTNAQGATIDGSVDNVALATLETGGSITGTVDNGGTLKLLDQSQTQAIENSGDISVLHAAVQVESLNMSGGTLFLDPAYAHVSMLEGGEVGGDVTVGSGSVLLIGEVDALQDKVATAGLSVTTAAPGFTVGTGEAALALGQSVHIGAGASLCVDPSKTAPAAGEGASASFAPGSLLVVSREITTEGNAAISSEHGKASIGAGAKLLVTSATADGVYTVLKGFSSIDNGGGWNGENLLTDSCILKSEFHSSGEQMGKVVTVKKSTEEIQQELPKADEENIGVIEELYETKKNDVQSGDGGAQFVSRATTAGYTQSPDRTIESADRIAIAGAVPHMSLMASEALQESMEKRTTGAGNDALAKEELKKGVTLWIAPFWKGRQGFSMEAGKLDYGFDAKLGGVALGCDWAFAEHWRAGAAFNMGGGYAKSSGDFAKTRNNMTFWGAGLYGNYDNGSLSIAGDISCIGAYSKLRQDVEESMRTGDLKADVKSLVLSAGAKGSWKIELGGIDLIPHAGVRYTSLKSLGYDINSRLAVAKSDGLEQSFWSFPVGVSLAKGFSLDGWESSISADFTLTPRAGDIKAKEDLRFTSIDRQASLRSQTLNRISCKAGVGAEIKKDNVGLSLNYACEGGENETEHSVNVSFRWEF